MATQTPADDVPVEQMTVNLQVVSPSVGVTRPLLFPGTPASTTIKALKAMIRDALPIRPADEKQRLIYRGKALLRDGDSLFNVMGPENIRSPDQHTIHLVLRDVEQPSASAATVPNNMTTSNPLPRPAPPFPEQLGGGPGRPPVPPNPAAQQAQAADQSRIPSPGPLGQQLPPPAAAAFQQQHQQLTSWLNQVQRDAMTRAIVNQNQRGRAQARMRGIADTPGAPGSQRDPSSRRGSPAPTHTIYRESHGANGHSYQVETVIRNPPQPGPQNGAYSIGDVQNILRGADAGHAASPMGAAMQRTASGASLPSRSVPAVLNMASASQQSSQPRQALDLYLLSSPEGPRGILINNSTLETFYTPRSAPAAPAAPTYLSPYAAGRAITLRQWLLTPPGDDAFEAQHREWLDNPQLAARRRGFEPAPAPHDYNPGVAPVPGVMPAAVHGQAPVAPVANPAMPRPVHAGNRFMAGLGQALVAISPHLWNIVRLSFFVWLFVGPNSSWMRWIVVASVAIFIFALGTGAFNGMGEHFWRPIVRHLESLFPTIDRPNQRRPVPAVAAAPPAQVAAPATQAAAAATQAAAVDPNPTDMAARLVAERNARRPWLAEQMRRVERAGLLFLASIAPGVAERHIANLEEEARREERRQREAEEAAAAAAAEAERRVREEAEKNREGIEAPGASPSEAVPGSSRYEVSDASFENHRGQVPAREPLVDL